MATKFYASALLLCTAVCYSQAQVQHNHHRESTSENILKTVDMNQTTNSTLIPVLQHSYNDNSPPRGLIAGVSTGILLLIACCVFCCCRCRRQMNQGVVVGVRPQLIHMPAPATQIVIQQHAAAPPPAQQTAIPPTYPAHQHAPPPYDTQPTWGPPPQQQFNQPPPQQQFNQPPPQQQFNQPPAQQQFPTSFANPNYVQPPDNMQYHQEKY